MSNSLTKRRFNTLAAVLRDNKPEADGTLEEVVIWENIVEDIGDMSNEFNDNFSYDKFFEACGYDKDGEHWLADKLSRNEVAANTEANSLSTE